MDGSLEYMPESHSIILNEYDEDLPKEINPSNFTIGEFVKKRFRITVHQGCFDDTLITVQTIKLRSDKMTTWKQNKDDWVRRHWASIKITLS